ncbi:phage virion morphogenesis protein [Escherichia coli]|uniref:phage virion morphogenesis protein n=1 Tax=Escherichia coli TaxID=562 RepID=UPI000DA44644|nr:phage virion morphogenesis protein [Escherichia coli]SQZ87241.1 phage virion morphogenesis protein [Escherichia coli]
MIHFNLNQPHLRDVLRAINEAELSPAKARKLLVRIAKYGLIPAAKRNVKSQRTPEGAAWAPRKRPDKASGRHKNKMLLGLPKLMAIRADNDGKTVRIYFKRGDYATRTHAGAVAQIQQNGARITHRGSRKWSAGVMETMREQPATRRQAHRLLSLGFRAPTGAVNKKTGRRNYRKPSLKWIMENMSRLQAGTVINILKGKEARNTWEITIPARAFLGASGEELTRILEAQLRSLHYGGTR